MRVLGKEFFERDAVKVARDLLGKVISVKVESPLRCGRLSSPLSKADASVSHPDKYCKGRIVETEAYGRDPASHAFKKTERSVLMFDSFGHVYVYLIYGMYWCLNFTTNPRGEAGAVLIRAVEPLSGMKKMKERRRTDKVDNLCSGPGKLCLALGIDKNFNGLKLGKEIKIHDDGYKVGKIGKSSRVGIKDALDLEWRFFIRNNKFVSKNV